MTVLRIPIQSISTKSLGIVVALLLLLVLSSTPFHIPHVDEPNFIEQAYRYHETGVPHSYIYKGVSEEERYTVVRHWLYVYVLKLIVDAGGVSIFLIRLFSIVCALLLAAMMYRYYILQGQRHQALVSVAILLLIPQYFYYFKIARPEMAVACFGFASYLCLRSALNTNRSLTALCSGLLAGVAAALHFHGWIFVGAGFIVLAFQRRYVHALLFLLSVLVVTSPYFIEVYQNIDLFRKQSSSILYSGRTGTSVWILLGNLLDEHKRILRKPVIFCTTIPVIIAMIARWRRYGSDMKLHAWYLILLAVLLGTVANEKTDKYALVLVPYFVLVLVDALYNVEIPATKPMKVLSSLCVFAFLANALIAQGIDLVRDQALSTVEYNAMIASSYPAGSTVVAPANMVFNDVSRDTIVATYCYRYYLPDNAGDSAMHNFCRRVQAQYLVFSKLSEQRDIMRNAMQADFQSPYFSVVQRGSDYVVYKVLP